MRRAPLTFLILIMSAAAPAMLAHADSTTTQTVADGGTVRSSPNAPSAENPVVVSVRDPLGCQSPPCASQVTYTIDLKDAHDPSFFDVPIPPKWTGPEITVSSDKTQAPPVSIEIDGSLIPQGWMFDQIKNPQFNVITRPCAAIDEVTLFFEFEALPDGDVRLTVPADGRQCEASRHAFSVSPFEVNVPQDAKRPLAGALRTGLTYPAAWMQQRGCSGYRCTWTATARVSASTAKKLKLKSTTVGSAKHIVDSPEGNGWKPLQLTPAARKAFKGAKKVVVVLTFSGKGAPGQKSSGSSTMTLQ